MANMHNGKKLRKVLQIMMAPMKVLTRAMELYIRFMNECNSNMYCSGAVIYPAPLDIKMPRSFNFNSSKERNKKEARELLPSEGSWTELESCVDGRKLGKMTGVGLNGMARRNYNVGVRKIGRIDEDMPCCFEGDLVYPRSKSCAFYNE